jgi:hypothetical protein
VQPGVQVLDFSASASPQRVRLAWKARDLEFIYRFHVYRSIAGADSYEIVGSIDGSTRQGNSYAFLDSTIEVRAAYDYKVQIVRTDGRVFWSQPIHVSVPPRSRSAFLKSVAPNPFSDHLVLEMESPQESHGEIRIFDVRGAEIRLLYHGRFQEGSGSFEWDGRNGAGVPVADGIYFVEVTLNGEKTRRKIIKTSN